MLSLDPCRVDPQCDRVKNDQKENIVDRKRKQGHPQEQQEWEKKRDTHEQEEQEDREEREQVRQEDREEREQVRQEDREDRKGKREKQRRTRRNLGPS